MFTRQELAARARPSALPIPPHETVCFESDAFAFDKEQEITAFRAQRSDVGSALEFWLLTLQLNECVYGAFGFDLCAPLSQAEFAELIRQYSAHLLEPLPSFLIELEGFRGGMRMSAEWNECAAIAEVQDVFIAFFWSTSA